MLHTKFQTVNVLYQVCSSGSEEARKFLNIFMYFSAISQGPPRTWHFEP